MTTCRFILDLHEAAYRTCTAHRTTIEVGSTVSSLQFRTRNNELQSHVPSADVYGATSNLFESSDEELSVELAPEYLAIQVSQYPLLTTPKGSQREPLEV